MAVTKKGQFGVRATCGDKLVFKTISYYSIIPIRYGNARGLAVEKSSLFGGQVYAGMNGVIADGNEIVANGNFVIVGILVSYLQRVQ